MTVRITKTKYSLTNEIIVVIERSLRKHFLLYKKTNVNPVSGTAGILIGREPKLVTSTKKSLYNKTVTEEHMETSVDTIASIGISHDPMMIGLCVYADTEKQIETLKTVAVEVDKTLKEEGWEIDIALVIIDRKEAAIVLGDRYYSKMNA